MAGPVYGEFGIAHVTLGGLIISCDEVYAGFLGVPVAEAVGRAIADFTDDAGSSGPETMIHMLIRIGEPMSVRRTFVWPDGSKVNCIFSLCLIRDTAGRPDSVVGVGQRVTAGSW